MLGRVQDGSFEPGAAKFQMEGLSPGCGSVAAGLHCCVAIHKLYQQISVPQREIYRISTDRAQSAFLNLSLTTADDARRLLFSGQVEARPAVFPCSLSWLMNNSPSGRCRSRRGSGLKLACYAGLPTPTTFDLTPLFPISLRAPFEGSPKNIWCQRRKGAKGLISEGIEPSASPGQV